MDMIIPTTDGVEYRVEADHSGFTVTLKVRERLENDPYGGRQVHAIDIAGMPLHPSEFQSAIESFCAALQTEGYDAKSALDYMGTQINALRGQAAVQAAANAQAAQAQADQIAAQRAEAQAQAQAAAAPVGAAVVPPAPVAPAPVAPAPVTPEVPPAPGTPVVPDVATLPGYTAPSTGV